MGYVEYWNLRERPFEELADTRFFFEGDDHREALERMLYVVNDRNMNMCLLTGEIGSGKTITKNVLKSSLSLNYFEVIDFENSPFPFPDLLYDIVSRITFRTARPALTADIEAVQRGDLYLLFRILKKQLEILVHEEKRHLVLIFDESQQMEDPVLDGLKNLTNLSAETLNPLTVFLVGQPEMRETVRRLTQVDQRIFLRFHLNNLDYNGSVTYINHRLRVAGLRDRSIFTSLAYERIFRATGGVPREINRLCKLALNYGFAHEVREISREDVEVIINDLETHR